MDHELPAPVIAPIPFADALKVLDAPTTGSSGSLIQSRTDAEAVRRFLREYLESPHTLRSYRKELERLLLWSQFVARKPFSKLHRDDIDALKDFLRAPPADWINHARAKRYSEEWRPFRGPLSGSTLRHAELVFNSLFAYLVDARYLEANPFNLVRRRTRSGARSRSDSVKRARRHQLSDTALACIFDWLATLPEDSPALLLCKRRLNLIFTLYLLTGARRSELIGVTSADLSNIRGRWWLQITGKGDKPADLPLGARIMTALTDYRMALELPPYPAPGEAMPLFAHLNDPLTPISDDMAAKLVKSIMSGAAVLAEKRGDEAAAHQLKGATTHWLRHTAIGRAVAETKDLVLGQQLARHASVHTTAGYSTVEDDALHDRATQALDKAINGLDQSNRD